MDKNVKVGLVVGSGLVAFVGVVLLLSWVWKVKPAEVEQQASYHQAEELYQPQQESPDPSHAPESLSAEVHPDFLQDRPAGSAVPEQAVLPPAVANTEESAKSNTFVMEANQQDGKDSSVAGTQLGPVSLAVSQLAKSDFLAQAPAPEPVFHTVQQGDSLYGIAMKYYGPEKAHLYKKILEANRDKISRESMIKPGTKLLIPTLQAKQAAVAGTATIQDRTYTVKPGDTLSEISLRKLGTAKRWREIMTLNGLGSEYSLKVGTLLKLPPVNRQEQLQPSEVQKDSYAGE